MLKKLELVGNKCSEGNLGNGNNCFIVVPMLTKFILIIRKKYELKIACWHFKRSLGLKAGFGSPPSRIQLRNTIIEAATYYRLYSSRCTYNYLYQVGWLATLTGWFRGYLQGCIRQNGLRALIFLRNIKLDDFITTRERKKPSLSHKLNHSNIQWIALLYQ